MEAFLSKKSPLDTERAAVVHGKGPSKPSARPSNLLFNPQPRPRQRIPWPTSTSDENAPGRERQHEGGGGYASSYSKLRVSRLTDQAPTAVSQIFAGLSFYFNGRSGDKQTMHLKGGVSKHGGRTTPFMSMKGVTHVIAENLSASKTDKAMKSLKMKVVHPDWITRCMAEGKLLPDAPFRVVRSQKLGMDNFFSSGDGNSGKEKRRGGEKRTPPGTPAASGGEERRREGKGGIGADRRREGEVASGGERRREGEVGGRREKDWAGLAAHTAVAAAAAAASASSSKRKAVSGGGSEVGSGRSNNLSLVGDAGRSCSGRGSSSCSSGGDAGRGCSGSSSSSYRGSCKENGNAAGVLPDRGSSKGATRQWSEIGQESGLHSSRSSHTAAAATAAARKKSRYTVTPPPAVNGGWHDLTGDDVASPPSPSDARQRKNNAPLDRRNASPR